MQHLRHGYAAEDARLRGREKRLEEELRQSELRHRQVQPKSGKTINTLLFLSFVSYGYCGMVSCRR